MAHWPYPGPLVIFVQKESKRKKPGFDGSIQIKILYYRRGKNYIIHTDLKVNVLPKIVRVAWSQNTICSKDKCCTIHF